MACLPITKPMELNNNTHTPKDALDFLDNNLIHKRISVSSGSGSNSDTSEDVDVIGSENKIIAETDNSKIEEQPSTQPGVKNVGIMRDGQAEKFIPEEFADIFPSLPDAVLNKLGLLGGEVHTERMNEEEVEQKFITLALAFTIDAATIKDRCTRQRRYRDQTETNLTTEIDKLIQKVTCIQPLCVDAHTAELLTGLLAQIDVIIRASYLAAISAERFGAVQHEERLADAVNLMINHVSLLRQQRDAIKKQFQYTKKVLQDTNSCEKLSPIKIDTSINNRFITRRRASIATIVQPAESNNKIPMPTVNGDVRRISRRQSDMSTRISALARPSRPGRLELGVDLCKIKEGVTENGVQNNYIDESDSEVASCTSNIASVTLRHKISTHYHKFVEKAHRTYEASIENGSMHDFLIFAALLCFILGVIILGNMLIELEFSKRGIKSNSYLSNLFSYFPNVNYFQNDK